MLLIDSNESRNHPDLVAMLSQHIEVDVADINQSPNSTLCYPDFVIYGASKMVGINRKTAGEWLSNTDACISQLQRELAGPVDHLVLLLEGIMRPIGHTGMMSYNFDWSAEKAWSNSPAGQVRWTRRAFAINPKHAQNEQTRLEFLGVQVVHTYSLEDTASKLIAFHELVMKDEPNRILERLIKPTVHTDNKFARQLMAFDGVGEEAALTIASSFNTVMELVVTWLGGGTIQDMMMRNGTRRIGASLEHRLQAGIGFTPVQTAESTGQEDAALSPLS